MSITLQILKNAMDKNDVEKVRNIQTYCKAEINEDIDKMAGNFKIQRDPFAEMNFVTEEIRYWEIMLRD